MAFFKLYKIRLLAVFVVIACVALWMLQGREPKVDTVVDLASNTDTIEEQIKQASYIEKIENFVLQKYNKEQLLVNIIEAKTYYNFKKSPILLLDVKLTTYDKSGKKGFVVSSNRANYLQSGEVFFNGEVSIKSRSGVAHKIDTESLIVKDKMSQIKSPKSVVYLGDGAKIHAEGMLMDVDDDTMELNGDVVINQGSGTEIKTRNLFVDQVDGVKHYHSSEYTSYLSEMSIINADKGMDLDMHRNITKLLGNVEILQNSGSKIKSNNLIIDQSNGGEVYKTDNTIRYQSKALDILAQGMYFDANQQKVELTGGVQASYE